MIFKCLILHLIFDSQWFISELTSNPINGILILAILFLIYKIFKSDGESYLRIKKMTEVLIFNNLFLIQTQVPKSKRSHQCHV